MPDKNEIKHKEWTMRLQFIGGSYLICLPKAWVREHVLRQTSIMLIQDVDNKTLTIKPLEAPKYDRNFKA